MFFDSEPEDGKASSPSMHGSPAEQYTELRVNLPSTSIEEISQEPNYNHHQPTHSNYEELPHHRHSLTNNGWVQPLPRRDRRPVTYGGAYVRDLGQCSIPISVRNAGECWMPNYSQWQPQSCDFVCSRCQRRVPKNSSKASRRNRMLGPELTSFESHYVSNLANQYVPIAGVAYANGGRVLSPTSRQAHIHCAPVQVHVQPFQAADQNSSVIRDSSSDSSLSLSAFHADYECSDSSSSPENFDSNRSVFGSSTTCRSDPIAVDPQLYAKPGAVDQEWANSEPVTLTPSCVHRLEADKSRPVRFSSDSEDVKRSGSEANASSGSNFSTKAHASCKASPHPYRPTGNGTFIQAFMHSAKQKSHSFPRTSGNNHTLNTSKRRHHENVKVPGGKSKDTRVKEIKSRPCKGTQGKHVIPCHCCSGSSVWEAKGQSSRGREHKSGERAEGEQRGESSKRLRDERTGKLRSDDKVQSKTKGERHGHRARKSRAHLSLPIQSIVSVDPVDGE